MILCKQCKRMWPEGTKWCGVCRATLGARYCENDHANALSSGCCTTCGTPKLTRGVPCLRLRAVSWVLLVVVGAFAVPPIWRGLLGVLSSLYAHLLALVAGPLISFAILSIAFSPLLNDKGRKTLGDIWIAMFRFAWRLIEVLTSILLGIAKRLLRPSGN